MLKIFREGRNEFDLWNFVLGILMVNAFTMGIACFVAPHAVNFGYFVTFSLIYGAFFGELDEYFERYHMSVVKVKYINFLLKRYYESRIQELNYFCLKTND